MNLLALDPGSHSTGWVLVFREHARVRYLTSGTCESSPAGFLRVLDTVATATRLPYREAVGSIALEVAEGMAFTPYRVPDLLLTAEMVGVVTGIAHDLGVEIDRFTAAQVRKALVGKASSPKKGVMDRLIGDAVRANVIAWPEASNVHCRDAAALAVVTAWKLATRRVA